MNLTASSAAFVLKGNKGPLGVCICQVHPQGTR